MYLDCRYPYLYVQKDNLSNAQSAKHCFADTRSSLEIKYSNTFVFFGDAIPTNTVPTGFSGLSCTGTAIPLIANP